MFCYCKVDVFLDSIKNINNQTETDLVKVNKMLDSLTVEYDEKKQRFVISKTAFTCILWPPSRVADAVFLHGSGSGFQISLDPDPVFKFLSIRFLPRFWKIAEWSLKVIY